MSQARPSSEGLAFSIPQPARSVRVPALPEPPQVSRRRVERDFGQTLRTHIPPVLQSRSERTTPVMAASARPQKIVNGSLVSSESASAQGQVQTPDDRWWKWPALSAQSVAEDDWPESDIQPTWEIGLQHRYQGLRSTGVFKGNSNKNLERLTGAPAAAPSTAPPAPSEA